MSIKLNMCRNKIKDNLQNIYTGLGPRKTNVQKYRNNIYEDGADDRIDIHDFEMTNENNGTNMDITNPDITSMRRTKNKSMSTKKFPDGEHFFFYLFSIIATPLSKSLKFKNEK
jgi:hypothetical protein